MKFFIYDKDNGGVALNTVDLLLTKEYEALMEPARNKTKTDKTGKNKELAFRECKYIYLFFDWESPYFNCSEQEKHLASLEDSGLSNEEFDNPVFKNACRKYDDIQNSSISLRLLTSARHAIESQIYYLNHVDLNERDPLTGKPIFKSKDLIAEIKGCKDLIVGLDELEIQVKKKMAPESGLRGATEAGFYD